MIRRPPRSTLDRSSAASDVYKRQVGEGPAQVVPAEAGKHMGVVHDPAGIVQRDVGEAAGLQEDQQLSLIHISEPTRPYYPRDRTRSRMPSSA